MRADSRRWVPIGLRNGSQRVRPCWQLEDGVDEPARERESVGSRDGGGPSAGGEGSNYVFVQSTKASGAARSHFPVATSHCPEVGQWMRLESSVSVWPRRA